VTVIFHIQPVIVLVLLSVHATAMPNLFFFVPTLIRSPSFHPPPLSTASGQEIRCDVAIAPISQLTIVTSSRTVYVDDAPEVLMVTGYDEEGNTFST
jgi:hypothetical protein